MIHFSCSCGKQLQTRESNAGQRVSCPECGARVRIPDPTGAAEEKPRRSPRRRENAEDEAPTSRTGLIIGGIVAGVVVVAAVVIVLIIVLNKDSSGADGRVGGFEEPKVRRESENNLRQITLAMHNYNSTYNRLPPAVVYGAGGQPLYSWRVLLLPYLEEQNLYQQFHLDEAWDSPHNKTLLARIPRAYARPRQSNATGTHYLVFDGPGAAFDSGSQSPQKNLRPFNAASAQAMGKVFEGGTISSIPRTFTDGTSNTIMVIEADKAVPWSKPEDVPFGPNQPLPAVGGLYSEDLFLVGLADGSVRTLHRKQLSDATFRAAITANGGEILGTDW